MFKKKTLRLLHWIPGAYLISLNGNSLSPEPFNADKGRKVNQGHSLFVLCRPCGDLKRLQVSLNMQHWDTICHDQGAFGASGGQSCCSCFQVTLGPPTVSSTCVHDSRTSRRSRDLTQMQMCMSMRVKSSRQETELTWLHLSFFQGKKDTADFSQQEVTITRLGF